MEKFHLPIFQANPFEPKVESREKELLVEFKIAKAFLFQRYPLSEKGEELRKKVVEIVQVLKRDPTDKESLECLRELKSELPTVEEPHLEMFAELGIAEDEGSPFLGPELVNVQVTKGCRHQCEHCAAGAEKDVKVMPFAAVLKMADRAIQRHVPLADLRGEILESLEGFRHDPRIRELGSKILESIRNITFRNEHQKRILGELTGEWTLRDLIYLTEWRAFEVDYYLVLKKTEFLDILSHLPPIKKAYKMTGRGDLLSVLEDLKKGFYTEKIVNYYDSDPFDYRDTTFLHRDGTPADYGDVVTALAPKLYPIEFTTAGWPIDDAVSRRAGEKISRLPKKYISNSRISLHPYEVGTTHGDPELYFRSMEKVIETLAPTDPLVIYLDTPFKPGHEKFLPVLKRLYELARSKGLETYGQPGRSVTTSRYAGRAAEKFGQKNEDFDVMSCMPGIHVWPDGSLHRQQEEVGIYAKKGARPRPLGKSIFKLKGKG